MESYEELVEALFLRFPSVQRDGFTSGAYKPGLEAMAEFDKALGEPSKALKVIHIAGTNGKGSVANMTAAALTSAGYHTGLFTSPHILDWRERSRIDGTMVPREYAEAFLRQWEPYFTEHNLSFFEITTGLALKWFADSRTDFAVLETGLGGRLDSTNIVTPVVSVITSIGLDHCALLGSTLEAIAGEKAGIIKPGVPVIIGEYRPETAPVFEAKARETGSAITFAEHAEPRLWHRSAEILSAMDLRAPVQAKNLRTVLCALDTVLPEGAADDEKLIAGITRTASLMHFHGRWERLRENPTVIADIGHNAHALRSNFAALEATGRPLTIVYGIMADKDLDSIIPLMPRRARYIFVSPDTPRALPAEEILRRFRAAPGTAGIPAETAPSVTASLETALRSATPDTLIYLGGSTFVVSSALQGTELEK